MKFIEYIKILLQSLTFWILFSNIFIDFQVLQYFLFMLIFWGNYNFIRSLIDNVYKDNNELIFAWIINFILHLLLPIFIIYMRKTLNSPLSTNNYFIGLIVSGIMILLIDTEYVYNSNKGRIIVEGIIMWTIILIISNIFIQKNKKIKNKKI